MTKLGRRDWLRNWWPVGLLLVLLLVGSTFSAYATTIANQVLITALAALGYNLMFGNAGQVSIGSAAFLGIGAFSTTGAALGLHLPFSAAVVIGGLAAALAGLVIGIPSLRLAGHYLIFGTLALNFVTLYVLNRIQDNPSGWSLPNASIAGIELGTDPHRWFVLYVVLTVATLWVVRNLLARRPGRAWTALREHPAAAAMMGVDVVAWRLIAFAFSSFLFGFAGGLNAYYLRQTSVDSFSLGLAILYVVVILVGGVGSTLGSVLGSAAVVAVPYLVQRVIGASWLSGISSELDRQQFNLNQLLYGLLLVAVLLFEPGGLAAAVTRLGRWAASVAGRVTRRAEPAAGAQPTPTPASDRDWVLPGATALALAVAEDVRAEASRGERLGVRAAATEPVDAQCASIPGLLRVAGLTVAYGSAAPAVEDVEVQAQPGQIVTVLGPNGAGKTTTMRAIAGFLPGESSRVTALEMSLGELDLRGLSALAIARHGLSFVPERDKVFRSMSLAANLRIRLPDDPAERASRLGEIYAIFPTLARIDQKREAGFLSGGERQMLAIAMALAGRPRILLLDEPTLGLAPIAIAQLGEALQRLRRERGLTVIMADQNVRLALDISDEICVLGRGRIVDRGAKRTWDEDRLRQAYLGGAAADDRTPQAAT